MFNIANMTEQFTIKYRVHAIKRMFERNISDEDVLYILSNGQVIQEYPDDNPYPSKLMVCKIKERFVHVVVAENISEKEKIIITVYEPDPHKWEPDFIKKRKK